MKSDFTIYERREHIKFLLLKKRHIKMQELSNMFGVSHRTILNDIVFLSSRIPIVTRTGPYGGVFLDIDYETPKEYLTEEEEKLLNELAENLKGKKKIVLHNIINKFSIPKKK